MVTWTKPIPPAAVLNGAGHVQHHNDLREAVQEIQDTLNTYDALPAGSTVTVAFDADSGSWPARPTDRTDIAVHWVGGTVLDAPVDAVAGLDYWDRPIT